MAKITLNAILSASSRGLQTAIDKAKQTVQTASTRMKQAIHDISDAFKPAIDNSRKLGDEMTRTSGKMQQAAGKSMVGDIGKKIAGGLASMAGPAAVAIAAIKKLGQAVNMLGEAWLNAGKKAREVAEYAAGSHVATADNNLTDARQMEADLKEYARLKEAFDKEATAVNKYAMQKQQRKLEINYGIEISNTKNFDKTLNEQLEYAQAKQLEAIRSKIKAYEGKNERIDEEADELTGTSGFFRQVAGNLGLFGQLTTGENRRRVEELQEQKGGNDAEIAKLKEQLRRLEKSDIAKDFRDERRARATDDQMARDEQTSNADRARADQMDAWKNSLGDTRFQADLRKVMEKYRDMVDKGVDVQEARNLAEREIAKLMDSRYNDYLTELQKRGEALKNARQKELDAQNKVIQAQNNLAEAIQAQADNERQERRRNRDKKRDKLQDRLEKAQDRAENAPRRRDRKQAEREVKVLQKRIAKIDRQNEKEDRQEEKRQSRQRRQRLQRNVDNARRQRNLAGSDADKARATRQQRQREQEAMRTPEGVRDRLKQQADDVIKSFRGQGLKAPEVEGTKYRPDAEDKNQPKTQPRREGKELARRTAPGVGGSGAGALARAYQGQLQQLHQDLQDIKRHAYFVK